MSLVLYNTCTRQEEQFAPLEPGKVRMYCCGVTVYDLCHLGHARSYIVWDVVRRYLQWCGYTVHYVQNFTDIDDKILNRAKSRGVSMQAIAQQYIEAYQEDMAKLNILPANAYPRATEVIPEIISLIKTLVDQGYAYVVEGDVYYAVERFPNYGKLSKRQLDQMEAGASGRVEDAEPKKHHPLDFVLWKAAKPEEMDVYTPWDSPWGFGRPGWHIECSAMVQQAFGGTIDIHAGGMDLIFPHHENEIAQSEAASHQALAHYWLHHGFVNIQGEKMSKSLNNFKTIRDLLQVYEPMALRVFVLQAHYRKPLDFTEAAIAAAQNSWHTLKEGLLFGEQYGQQLGWTLTNGQQPLDESCLRSDMVDRFRAAMDADFNTPIALSVLFELAKDLRRERNILVHQGGTESNPQLLAQQWQTLVHLARVLGLEVLNLVIGDASSPAQLRLIANDGTFEVRLSDAEIEVLIQKRQESRQAKNYAEGDRIRNELQAQGITLIDQPGGVTRWHRN
jgi:cysteinyl-tRNA synthetase